SVTGIEEISGSVTGSADYAYLMPPMGMETTLAIYDMIKKGIRGGISNREITINGKKYPRGTAVLYVKNGRSPVDTWYDLEAVAREMADKYGVSFFAVSSGLADKGIDLGSSRISRFKTPKVAVVGGTGNIRHMFDHRYNIDFVNIDATQLGNLDIEDVNVVILSGGANLNESAMNNFKAWVRAGGNIVGWGRAIQFVTSDNAGFAS
ncbi:MAG: ThuA domain-containing protein, partial [Planctomycetes bacterium]|nr:ThuA domain-containing protein [Planctomycetota bacterium]